jgi:deoxyadenosine/deoxycytidine kinase
MSSPYKRVLVTIEGNIGGGKSTMINLLRKQYPEYTIIDEPVDQWLSMKNEEGKSLLQLFYEDKQRWSYTFQNCAFITRYLSAFQAMNKPIDRDTIYISERGILTDRYVFATMLRDSGCLTQIEWDLYTKWFDHFKDTVKAAGIVYITTDPNVCKDRIAIRARTGEDGIPQEYLNELTMYHDRWIDNTDVPVLRITSEAKNVDEIHTFVQTLL